jgi:S-adenosylmethionine-diacylgycerolhomoserine-N-methlytransferase
MLLSKALRNDFVVLRQMLRGMPQASSHADRLQGFYATQAEHYDAFRERLLPGRAQLVARLPASEGIVIVELGGGTGRNLDYFGSRIESVSAIEIVDLCPALLEQTHVRTRRYPQARVIEADATMYRPEQAADCVYFSYALTMIPRWQDALANAIAMLKPGGILGVVDFYVPQANGSLLRSVDRWFWRRWFAHDGVHLDTQHLDTLKRLLPDHELGESRARLPYMPGLRVPFYTFVGRKPT